MVRPPDAVCRWLIRTAIHNYFSTFPPPLFPHIFSHCIRINRLVLVLENRVSNVSKRERSQRCGTHSCIRQKWHRAKKKSANKWILIEIQYIMYTKSGKRDHLYIQTHNAHSERRRQSKWEESQWSTVIMCGVVVNTVLLLVCYSAHCLFCANSPVGLQNKKNRILCKVVFGIFGIVNWSIECDKIHARVVRCKILIASIVTTAIWVCILPTNWLSGCWATCMDECRL